MSDIVNIKQAFHTLNRLKVKEVILPYKEYHELKDTLSLYCDDGGSHNYQERFDEFPRMWIFGIEVKHEGI
jgi:hypothetical protein